MEDRRHDLLAAVVREFVRQAEPVGSQAVASVLGVSSATVRNDMAALEQEGYLAQPHTSAGRVPTLKGYQFYLDNLLEVCEPKPAEQRSWRELAEGFTSDYEHAAKAVARKLAEVAGEAAVIGFSPTDAYYTGLSNLFAQPEFAAVDMVRTIGRAIDHLDEAVAKLYRQCGQLDVVVKIGTANPLGEDCALILTSYEHSRGTSLLGLFGPLRMDYDANIGRLQYVRTLIS